MENPPVLDLGCCVFVECSVRVSSHTLQHLQFKKLKCGGGWCLQIPNEERSWSGPPAAFRIRSPCFQLFQERLRPDFVWFHSSWVRAHFPLPQLCILELHVRPAPSSLTGRRVFQQMIPHNHISISMSNRYPRLHIVKL